MKAIIIPIMMCLFSCGTDASAGYLEGFYTLTVEQKDGSSVSGKVEMCEYKGTWGILPFFLGGKPIKGGDMVMDSKKFHCRDQEGYFEAILWQDDTPEHLSGMLFVQSCEDDRIWEFRDISMEWQEDSVFCG